MYQKTEKEQRDTKIKKTNRDQEIPIATVKGWSAMTGMPHLKNHMLCNGTSRA